MPTRPLRERATPRSFVDILRDRAGEDPGRHAFSFLVDGEQQTETLTYGELDRRARALAARLVGEGAAGERVLLLLPPGLDYLVGVFGILYAGAVVVPAFPPRPGRSTKGVDTIIEDAAAGFALRRAGGRPVEADALRRMVDIDPAEVDDALAESWRAPRIRPGQLALLQYTSGSTSAPRGAMATHDQLVSMSEAIRKICGATPEDRGLWWVPPYHDLGLFASILQPVFVGNPTTLMPPLAFLQRPMRWLEAMSRERATMGGGPNFAYELVVEQSRPEERAALDLSSWRIALNGAEPVRPETMARFAEAFAPAGFRREAFFVAYGLAESLPVTTTQVGAGTTSVVLDAVALASRRAQPSDAGRGPTTEIVSCGAPAPEAAVAIVNPENRRRLPDGTIGEVWVSGPNVIRSYWRRPADTRRVLRARIAGEGATPWLRTGDLGFLRDGELYVTGRLKEMLIIRGRNYYPLDIERTVEEAHPDIRRSGVAAVGLPGIGDDRLAVVAEVQRRSKTAPDALLAAIRHAMADEHDLRASRIVLITEGRLPRTSSGKIQRLAAATAVQNNDLKAIADWTDVGLLEPTVIPDEAIGPLPGRTAGPSAREIERWLGAHLAEKLGVAPDSLDRDAPFGSFGLGSVEATALAGELATFLDRPLSPTLTWEFPTIERLAHHLADDPVDAPDPYVAAPQEPIAIVGIGLRMPGADTLEEFRDLLRNGRDAIRRTPDERWDADAYYDPTPATPGKIVTQNGGFLEGVSLFDPQFFGISPREASRMDPQQRIILEVTQAALDSAGIAPGSLAGSATGVFIGIGAFEYSLGPASTGDITVIDAHIGTGNAHSIAANRVSFLYDLRGPSVALDTACSSSLVAIHLACQSLYSRESDAALAGGVNLIVAPTFSIAASQARMLSPDGLCKTFDAGADGYVRSEGASVVVLKRLADARRDGDRILALIRSTAVNQDGLTSGITAPNGRAQQEVVRTALARAGIKAADLGAIEAHGTGTAIGDPIEVNALAEVVGQRTEDEQRIWLGSVKANVGHMEVASAMAGLAKVILELQHGEIYPQIHLSELNPRIRIAGTPLTIPSEVQPFPMGPKPRYVGISSFGFGGTNAHMVVEEAREPIVPRSHVERPVHIASLSGKSEAALRDVARRTAADLVARAGDPFPLLVEDVAYTLNVGRGKHLHRAAVVAASTDELIERLGFVADAKARQGIVTGKRAMHPPSVAFLYTGQGAQYAGMGRTLYETQPTFRAALDRVSALVDAELDRPLLGLLFPAEGEPDLLAETVYTQPALFALEYALSELWRGWGVEPEVVLGHSVGEYVAAVVAEALSLEDAVRLIAARGRLMHALPRDEGAMAAILAPLEVVEAAVEGDDDVEIAGINAPDNITISGRREAVERVSEALAARDIRVVPLNVSHAFHSPLMEPILAEFEQLAASVQHRPLKIAMAANLTGKLLGPGATLDAQYWREHARRAVRFADDVKAAHEFGAQIFVEVGPNPTLTGMGRRTLSESNVTWATSLKAGEDDWRTLLQGVATVFGAGRDIDWVAFDRDYRRQRVALPSYPFERSHFWFEPEISGRTPGASTAERGHPLTRTVMGSPYGTVQAKLSLTSPPFLADHQVQGSVVVPGTMFVELMLDAGSGTAGGADVPVPALDNVEFARAMFLQPGATETVQAIASPDGTGGRSIHVYSRPASGDSDWTLRASGSLAGGVSSEPPPADPTEIDEAFARCATEIDPADFYHYIGKLGLMYEGAFQGITKLGRRPGEAVARIEAPESIRGDLDRYHIHPALLDAIAQVFAVAGPGTTLEDAKGLYLPVGLGRLRARRALPAAFWAHVTLDELVPGAPTQTGTLRALDDEGNLILQVDEWRVQMLDADARAVTQEPISQWLYQVAWQPLPEVAEPVDVRARSVVVLADASGLGTRLADALGRLGHTTRLVDGGQPATREDVTAAWSTIMAADEAPWDTVVCLWPLDAAFASLSAATMAGTGAANASVGGPVAVAGNGRAKGNGRPKRGGPAETDGQTAGKGRNGRSTRVADHGGGPRNGTDAGAGGNGAAEPAARSSDEVVSAALGIAHLVQGMTAAAPDGRSRLVLVTRGASAGFEGGDESSLLQAPVTGLARVIRMEYPQLDPIVIDLDPESSSADADTLARTLSDLPAEPELVLRGDAAYVRRLVRVESEVSGDDAEGERGDKLVLPAGQYRLESTQPGMLDRLALKPALRRTPGPGEVEVQVQAAGVNFRDVMKALGIYPMQPGDVPWLGDEFAGRVLAAGEGVDLEVGQAVFGVAPAAFGSAVSTRADYVLPMPEGLSPEDAATLPVVFTTALHALTGLARLQPGERVLIHAAAGGVGQAAIQIARSIGAEIYATASESKRDVVRSLGVEHVYDSRSLEFADQIREDTGGRGVDVVLNHLAGDFIPASISVLAPYGRFIEIGKRDIFANSKIGLWPFRNNLAFFAVDMDRLGRDKPAVYRDLLQRVYDGFKAGIYTPLSKTVYPVQSAVSAFRLLAQGRHIGKVVLTFDVADQDRAEEGVGFRGDSTYLITGGLRGLGARVAEWMALRGARNLVLLGRDPSSEAAQETATRVAAAGGRATLLAADVGVREQVDAVMAHIDASLPPIRGIVHAAGTLADGILSNVDDRQFGSVFGPKAVGALNLHRATLDRDLDFFISFSSTASLMGNPGQGNYAAANAFLDRLAWYRRSIGRAAQTIHWGPWSEIGMSATAQGQRSFDFGVGTISPTRGIEALGVVADGGLPEVAVMPMDWSRFISRLPAARTDPFLAVIREGVELDADAGAASGALREAVLAAPEEERAAIVEQFVQTELARVLELDPEALPLDQPLNTVGLDSLMALELKNRVEVGIGINLPIVSLIQGPSISQLAAEIVKRIDAPAVDEPDLLDIPTPSGTASVRAGADSGEAT